MHVAETGFYHRVELAWECDYDLYNHSNLTILHHTTTQHVLSSLPTYCLRHPHVQLASTESITSQLVLTDSELCRGFENIDFSCTGVVPGWFSDSQEEFLSFTCSIFHDVRVSVFSISI